MRTLLRAVRRANALASRAIGAAVVMLLAGLAGVVIISVFFRYVLNSSLVWSEEAARYLDAWLIFLGLAVAHSTGSHVRIGLLFEKVPAHIRGYLEALSEAVLLGLLLTLAYFGLQLVLSNFERGQTTPAMQISIAWIYLSVPVGLILMSLQCVERLLALLLGEPLSSELAPPEETREIEAQAAG